MSEFSPLTLQETAPARTASVAEFCEQPMWHVGADAPAAIDPLTAEREQLVQATAMAEQRAGELAQMIDAFRQASADLSALGAALRQDAPPQLAEIAMFVAEHIVDTAIHTQPNIVLTCIERLLVAERPVGDATLEINPEDHALLTANAAEAFAKLTHHTGLALQMNETLPRGVCRIITEKFHLEENLPRRVAAVWHEVHAAHSSAAPQSTETATPPA